MSNGSARSLRICPWVSVALVFAMLLSSHVLAAQASVSLVLGRVSDDPKTHYARLKPLLDYVVPHLKDLGITQGRVLMARDAQQMVSYLRQGKVDWITETAGAALVFEERAKARIFLRARRGGLFNYHSVFFARKDHAIREIRDLRGRSLGLQHPSSTSAYLVPAIILLDAGLPLAIQASPLDRPPLDFVGYAFARSEGNLVTWVEKGLVDAAAFSNQDWDELVQTAPLLADQLEVFHESEDFPRAVELFRSGLDPQIQARIEQVLLAAHKDPAATAALRAYSNTERFDAVDAQAAAMLAELRVGVRRVRAEIE